MKTLEQLRSRYIGERLAVITTSNYNKQVLDLVAVECNGVSEDTFRFSGNELGCCTTRTYDKVMLNEETLRNYFNRELTGDDKQLQLVPLETHHRYGIKMIGNKLSVLLMYINEDQFTGAISLKEVYNGNDHTDELKHYHTEVKTYTRRDINYFITESVEEVIVKVGEWLSNNTEYETQEQYEIGLLEDKFRALDTETQLELVAEYYEEEKSPRIYTDFGCMIEDETPFNAFEIGRNSDIQINDDENVYWWESHNVIASANKYDCVNNTLCETKFIDFLRKYFEQVKQEENLGGNSNE